MSTHPKRAYPFLHIDTIPHIPQQYLCRSMAIAVRFVMVQGYTIEITHRIQTVDHAWKMPSPDPDGAIVLHTILPSNTIILQAALQYAQIKGSIVSDQDAAGHQPLNPPPQLWEGCLYQ